VDAEASDGYYQSFATKAGWLRKQWYRYLAARWGYSTAVLSWELNNEGHPEQESHWSAAQEFAAYLHAIDAHPHLATTSFWCCWEPDFWGDSAYADVDYADLHEYTDNAETAGPGWWEDFAGFILKLSEETYKDRVGKPVLLGETGLVADEGPTGELTDTNPGVWYHNMLWAQLAEGSLMSPNYWFSEHIEAIDKEAIGRPFSTFVRDLDVNQGGYTGLEAKVSAGGDLRIAGQKNTRKGKAYLWIQHPDHTWENVADGVSIQPVSASIRIPGFAANRFLRVEWWNTETGAYSTHYVATDPSGVLTLKVKNLSGDIAVRVGSYRGVK
jgi:hypothetical protein